MQATHQTFSWLVSLKRNVSGPLSIMLLVSWASLLTVHTIQLQHSCKPLLGEVKVQYCPEEVIVDPFDPSIPNPSKDIIIEQPQPPLPQGSNDDLIAIATGSAAIVGLAVIGTPVAIAVGVGTILGFVVIKLMGH